MLRFALRQGFRLYGLALLIVAGWTGGWTVALVGGSSAAIGTAWIAIGALGIVLLVGFLETRERTFVIDEDRRRTFNTSPLTGMPLTLYITGLLGWSLVSFGWVAIETTLVTNTIVAYGWFGIAAVGGALTLGMCVTHSEALIETVSPSSTWK